MHNLKVISEVLFGDLIEDNTLGDHLSKTSIYKRILLKKKKKEEEEEEENMQSNIKISLLVTKMDITSSLF